MKQDARPYNLWLPMRRPWRHRRPFRSSCRSLRFRTRFPAAPAQSRRADAMRTKIVLLAAQSVSNLAIAERLGHPGHGSDVAEALRGEAPRRAARRTAPGRAADRRRWRRLPKWLTAALEALPAADALESRGVTRASGSELRRCSASYNTPILENRTYGCAAQSMASEQH
jgi:hypothetical protein